MSETIREPEAIKKLRALKEGTIYNLLISDVPPLEYIIDKLIGVGQVTAFFGPGQHFKTTFCLYLALCIATGTDTFLYKANGKRNVLWIDEEMGITGLKLKTEQLVKGMMINKEDLKDSFYYSSVTGFKLDDEKNYGKLKRMILEKKISVVFIDSIARVMSGDENSVRDVAKLHDIMRMLAEETRVTFIIIHHTSKYSGKKNLESMRGSGDFGNQVDDAFCLECVDFNLSKYMLLQAKTRYTKPLTPINFVVLDDSDEDNEATMMKLTYVGTVAENVNEKIELVGVDILKWMREHPQPKYTYTEIVNCLSKKKIGKNAINDALRNLCEIGTLEKLVNRKGYILKPTLQTLGGD